MILVASLRLRAGQRCSGGTVDRLKSQKILRPDLGDGAFQHGSAPCALAEFLRNLRRKPGIERPAHHAEGLLGLLVRDDAQERRLLQLYCKSLAKRAIENGVLRSVSEVG